MVTFPQEFEQTLKELYPNGPDWDLVGILTRRSKVYTLSYDSKILSGIFEILIEPIIKRIADKNGMAIYKAAQNKYPEFSLVDRSRPSEKIAIDVKTTYRRRNKDGKVLPYAFTLGSYRSYLRDPKGKKGILFPYPEYSHHWVIGFVYDRNPNCAFTDIKEILDATKLETPYTNIEYFIQEKYKIAGKYAGSSNTTNISSFKSNSIADFRDGKGPFTNAKEFETFWGKFEQVRRKVRPGLAMPLEFDVDNANSNE